MALKERKAELFSRVIGSVQQESGGALNADGIRALLT